MPWHRNGHSVPVIYKGPISKRWLVDWSFDYDDEPFDTWGEALEFALGSIYEVSG